MTGAEAARAALADRDPHTEPDNLPAPASGTVGAFGPPDQVRILQLLGLDPRNPLAHAVVAVCDRYGLDPLLGHVIILPRSNKPYITRDAYLDVAHRSGVFNGIEISGPRRDGAEREWACSASVYRKDMDRPFTYPGRAGLDLENGPEMAIARAERRALKRAFNLPTPVGFAEDAEEDRLPAAQPGQPAGAAAAPGKLTAEQRGEIQALFRQTGVSDTSAARARVLREWGYPSTANLSEQQADEVIARLRARLDEQNAPAGDEGDGGASFPDAPPPPQEGEPDAPPITREQRIEITRRLEAAGVTDRAHAMALISDWTGRLIHSTEELEGEEIDKVLREAAELPPDPRDD
ncbi:MAG: hypothetical protein J2P30_15665 [Actinobacteria bacterium]|nr:hypothetical protein [Actinomycetota bacterium]